MTIEVPEKFQTRMKKLYVPLLISAILTGCADGNIHHFLDSTFLNTVAPSVANVGKAFYPERYSPLLPIKVPQDFADTAPDHIGPWVFWGFSGDLKTNFFQANYYDPATVKRDGSKVSVSTFTFFNQKLLTQSNKPYLSTVIDYTFYCDESTYKLVHAKAYSTTRTTGNLVSDKPTPNALKPSSTKDGGDILRLQNKVCS